MEELRAKLKDKKRVVVKIGSSSLQHSETGDLDYTKMDILVRELCNIRNQGKDVILVTSGAIGCGRKSLQIKPPLTIAQKQACAAIGQARLMTTYQRIFSEYSHQAAQILLTRNTIEADLNRRNAQNTFNELLAMEVIPVVNENDTISTFEVEDVIGDNDTLSAVVTALTGADLLILLSDIDGLYTDDPRRWTRSQKRCSRWARHRPEAASAPEEWRPSSRQRRLRHTQVRIWSLQTAAMCV